MMLGMMCGACVMAASDKWWCSIAALIFALAASGCASVADGRR